MTGDDLAAEVLHILVDAGQRIIAAAKRYAASQITAAVKRAPGETRGEPRVHLYVGIHPEDGYSACGVKLTSGVRHSGEPRLLRCHGCKHTVVYKTASTRKETQ